MTSRSKGGRGPGFCDDSVKDLAIKKRNDVRRQSKKCVTSLMVDPLVRRYILMKLALIFYHKDYVGSEADKLKVYPPVFLTQVPRDPTDAPIFCLVP